MNAERKQHPPSHPGVNFADPATIDDPSAAHAKLRAECPVHYVSEANVWMVTRYEDVRRVLLDWETFSNNSYILAVTLGDLHAGYQDTLRARGSPHVHTLIRTDPPVHTRHRAILNKALSRMQVKNLAPRIEQLVNQLIDAWIGRGTCDFIADFAIPLPGIIISQQIGLDPAEFRKFKAWADILLAAQFSPQTRESIGPIIETELELQHYLHAIFEARRADPRDDIISTLVHAESEDGEKLTEAELQSLLKQLINGGFDTTTNALGHAAWALARWPELQDRLRAEPGMVVRFVEESLRFESPTQGLVRRVTRDTEIAGVKIPAGATVMPRYGAANRDETVFACPEKFDINRDPSTPHMAFSTGIHICAGAPLARLEMQIAIRALLHRLRNIRLARPLPYPAHRRSIGLLEVREMPLAFDAV